MTTLVVPLHDAIVGSDARPLVVLQAAVFSFFHRRQRRHAADEPFGNAGS